jgi:hypothetical protein
MTSRRALTAGLALTALAAAVSPAFSHTGGSNGYASIAIGQGSIRYNLTLWPSTLPSTVAEELRLARAGRVDSRDRLLGFIRDKITLVAQGRRCTGGPGFLLPPPPHGESVTLVVDFVCADAAVRDLLIRDDLFDVLGADYHTLARIEAPGFIGQFAFSPETRQTRLRLGGAGERGGGIASFFLLGVEHILSGYDHLLFLLALLLGGGGFVAMLKIVTAFTLAHSVTLALAVLDVVVVPDRLVEAAIALSIAVVAAENLVRRRAVQARWVASFVFGLVHGFGFSSALRELGLPREGLALALLGFNLGVEAGQALVVALALPLLLGLRRTRWEWRVVAASSAAILLIGLILFVERAAGW